MSVFIETQMVAAVEKRDVNLVATDAASPLPK